MNVKLSFGTIFGAVGGELGSDITICTMGKIRGKVQVFVTKDIVFLCM